MDQAGERMETADQEPSQTNYRGRLNVLLAKHRSARDAVRNEKTALEVASKQVQNTEQAQQILQQIAQTLQNIAHQKISSVVSRCLEAVFPDEGISFHIEFEKKRGKTEAVLLFIKDGEPVDPLSGSGGGCVDVAALALRLACLALAQPKARQLLVGDEMFKGVSPDYRPLVPVLLETLSKELNMQFLLTTNFPEYVVGKEVEL